MADVKSAADIVAEMVSAMRVSDPELDTSIGSVTRKIFDVVGEQVAPAYAVSYLRDWIYSIETKSGSALDDYCAQFGIYRIAARRATGLIEFSRTTAAKANTPIPANTYVVTGTTPRLAFMTFASGWILKGTKAVTIPVQAVNPGASGNLPVGSITTLASAVSGIQTTVKQADATTGGLDAESDDALRSRFRRTVFRSLAGTEDMFLGVALEDTTPDDDSDRQAVDAIVIGPVSRWSEQVQIGADGTAKVAARGQDKYIFPDSSTFGPDIANGDILTEGVHYTFDTSTPLAPTIRSIDTNLEVGTLYDIDYEYVSDASRNDPLNGITNRIDIWVSGIYPELASETTYWQPKTFSSDATNRYYTNTFVRFDIPSGDPIRPVADNLFLQLSWGPIVEFPDVLVISGVTYTRNTDFWVVHDDSAFGYSPSSMFGLEFAPTKAPPLNAQIVLSGGSSYYYNRLPRDVEARASKWKLVTTDVKAHAAKLVRLRFNLAVMYSASYERGAVQAALDSALANWVQSIGFHSTIQISDLLQVAHNVPGVDNIRLLNDDEPAIADDPDSWGVETVNADGGGRGHLGLFVDSLGVSHSKDNTLMDNQIPVLYDVRYVTKAQNTFGVI